ALPVAPLIRDFTERVASEHEQESPESAAPPVRPQAAREITFSLEGDEEIFGTLENAEVQPAVPYVFPNLQMLARPKGYTPGKDVDHTS
ncbi:DNA translocase FtsK, partial [Anoxybacillus sp. LAT27]|nr:DNA translocase FtsK [Anoxybacillus sp. LAT27]